MKFESLLDKRRYFCGLLALVVGAGLLVGAVKLLPPPPLSKPLEFGPASVEKVLLVLGATLLAISIAEMVTGARWLGQVVLVSWVLERPGLAIMVLALVVDVFLVKDRLILSFITYPEKHQLPEWLNFAALAIWVVAVLLDQIFFLPRLFGKGSGKSAAALTG